MEKNEETERAEIDPNVIDHFLGGLPGGYSNASIEIRAGLCKSVFKKGLVDIKFEISCFNGQSEHTMAIAVLKEGHFSAKI